jgi:hypothetical protein
VIDSVTPDAAPLEMSDSEIRDWLKANARGPKSIQVCPVGASEWQTADLHGFADQIPW